MRIHNHNITPKKQSGAVLFVSLVLLVVMTLIGITGMQTTILEEKMSGNYKDKTIALQAAESALKSGENQILNTAFLPAFDGSVAGLYRPTAVSLGPRWNTVNWANPAEVIADPVAFASVAQQPAYIIEKLDVRIGTSTKYNNALVKIQSYRVTARGTGSTINSPVMSQTVFNKFE